LSVTNTALVLEIDERSEVMRGAFQVGYFRQDTHSREFQTEQRAGCCRTDRHDGARNTCRKSPIRSPVLPDGNVLSRSPAEGVTRQGYGRRENTAAHDPGCGALCLGFHLPQHDAHGAVHLADIVELKFKRPAGSTGLGVVLSGPRRRRLSFRGKRSAEQERDNDSEKVSPPEHTGADRLPNQEQEDERHEPEHGSLAADGSDQMLAERS
jgi:hypothetical protein